MRVAVVGCGKIAARHVDSFEELRTAGVFAVSDISPGALASAASKWPAARTFRDYRQMLAEVKPEIVSVCTWPQQHSEIVCEASRAGAKGILVEKPIALRLDEIDEMVRECEARGVKLGVGHQYRFSPVFVSAKEMLKAGRIGRPSKVVARIRGSIANNGPHLVDTVRFVLGDPAAKSVKASLTRDREVMERGLPSEESAVSLISFEGDIRCEMLTGDANERAFEIIVEGSEGTLAVTPEGIALNGKFERVDSKAVSEKGRRRQFREFVEWMQGKRATYAADGVTARATAEICLACYESARQGGVDVPLPIANRADVISQLYPHPVASGSVIVSGLPADRSPALQRIAMDGGARTVSGWPSNRPAVGVAELKNLAKVIWSGNLNCNGGQFVRQLEEDFAALYGVREAVATSSGTSALHTALAAVNPEPFDEVITTPLTDMGSVIPILACNCLPIFADVDPRTGNMTAETILAKITKKTKAVILVHLFGVPADLDEILRVTSERGIAVIEDCAQAHLAEYKGKKVGTLGDVGCFSLQQSKQITCGDGGVVLVNRSDLAERARLFVDKGWDRKSSARLHRTFGVNYRMTELQGAVAVAQLVKLPRLVRARRTAAERLCERLKDIRGVSGPRVDPQTNPAWWKFAIKVNESEAGLRAGEVSDALRVEGAPATMSYLPRPLFEETVLKESQTYGASGFPLRQGNWKCPVLSDYPGYEEFDATTILLPWNSHVTSKMVDGVADGLQKIISRCSRPTKETVVPSESVVV